jgi:membrane-associated phospholipid phosphatase
LSRPEVRVEDVLAGATAVSLVAVAGGRSLGSIRLTEQNYWDFAFLLFPLALLVFLAAVRYAFRPMDSASQRVGGQAGQVLRDWLPFCLFLMMYEAFRVSIWNLVAPVEADGALLAWDRRLLGETPSVPLDSFVRPWATSLLTVAYAMHLVLPPIVGLLWYRRDLRVFREFLMAVLITGIIGSAGYLFVPAIGPGLAFPQLYHHSLRGRIYEDITGMIDAARALRDAFPSLHVAISSLVLYYAGRRGRIWFAIALPLVLGNWFSTIYLRFHYLVDVFAGWATAALAIALAQALLTAEARIKRRAATAPAVI